MPYKSDAQARYFNANRGKLEREGVNVDEWNKATNFKNLPERKMKRHNVDLGKKGSFSVKTGSLHRMLGIPEDKKIPASDLQPHEGDSTLLRRRKASAKGFKAMHHGK
jgi:hypothetical protein